MRRSVSERACRTSVTEEFSRRSRSQAPQSQTQSDRSRSCSFDSLPGGSSQEGCGLRTRRSSDDEGVFASADSSIDEPAQRAASPTQSCSEMSLSVAASREASPEVHEQQLPRAEKVVCRASTPPRIANVPRNCISPSRAACVASPLRQRYAGPAGRAPRPAQSSSRHGSPLPLRRGGAGSPVAASPLTGSRTPKRVQRSPSPLLRTAPAHEDLMSVIFTLHAEKEALQAQLSAVQKASSQKDRQIAKLLKACHR